MNSEAMRSWRRRVLAIMLLGFLGAAVCATGTGTPNEDLLPPPTVTWHTPVKGQELPVDGAVEIWFDREMDRQSVEAAFDVKPSLEGTWTWTNEGSVIFRPTAEWSRDTIYTVEISPQARDTGGIQLLEAYSFTIRTIGYLDVTQTIPANGTTEVEADSTLLVMFNRPVVPLLAVSDPARNALPQPLRFDPEVEGIGEWLNTSIYSFTPAKPLAGGTTYTVSIPAGLTDATGAILAEDATWQFVVERPRIVWIDPSRDEDLVSIESEITASFNMPIAAASAEGRVSVRTAGLLGEWLSRDVPGTVLVDGNLLTFTPDQPFEFDQRYVVTVDAGITGAEGGAGTSDPTTWSFSTVPLPRIIGTSPRDGERAAYPYTAFEIEFNAPIDPDTVMDQVTIVPMPAPEEEYTYYNRWNHSYVIHFGAKPSTEYTVSIGPEIADPYGNKTGQTLVVHFKTAALDPAAWLHVPGNIGTYSTYEPARIVVGHRNTDTLHITLTELTLDDYFDAITDWYDFRPPAGRTSRSWSQPVDSMLNETAYTPVDLVEGAGRLEPGIYAIDLEAAGVPWSRWNSRHILIASPLNLTLKTTDRETLVWVTDLESGAPVPGMILWAYDGDGDRIDDAVTGSDGLATLPGESDVDWRGMTVAGRAPFVLGSTEWNDGISPWSFGFYGAGARDERVYVDTDRPIYRAGDTVSFRGVVRAELDAQYTVPPFESVDVLIRDSEWNLVLEETLPLDDYGIFSGQIELSASASLGDYQIRVETPGETTSHSFQVAAYSPPEFDVTVTPEVDETVQGKAIHTLVKTAYFFGAPVTDAEISWRVLSEPYHFGASQFPRFSFDDVDDPWTCWRCWWIPTPPASVVLEGTGTTDSQGNLLIELPQDIAQRVMELGDSAFFSSQRLTIEATASGRDGRELSGRAPIVVHQGDFYIGLAAATTIGQAGKEMIIDAVTVDWEGERVAGTELQATIYRREWLNTFEEDETGGRWTWRVEDKEIDRMTASADALGEASLSFIPPEAGSYKIAVRSTDAGNREVRSSLFVWVSGPGTVSWRRSNDDRITLVSDKTTYQVGDTAEILIPSPYPDEQWALVTVERDSILSREVVHLPSNSSVIRIPIGPEHIPNVYVGVVLVQGRAAALAATTGAPAAAGTKVGYVALTVDPAPKVLRIDIDPSTAEALPASEVGFDITVTDASGLPVQAALSLDLVDKAILTLQPRTPGAIVETYYGRRGLAVSTASGLTLSLNRLVLEQVEVLGLGDDTFGDLDKTTAGAAPMAVEAAMDGLARAEEPSAAAQLPAGVEVREEFLDTAYWNAGIITDEDGRAHIEVRVPDNLTTWVARAVGATVRTEVGESTEELLVTKPLIVRPVTPRFFVVGDRVQLAALVSNQTEETLSTQVTIASTGLALDAPAVQTVDIAPQSEMKVSWWVTVLPVAEVDLAFSAVAGELADAARPRLTTGEDGTIVVYRYSTPETVGTAGQLTEEGTRVETVALPPTFDPARSELSIRLDASLAAALKESLTYLEHFEYECTEQLVSRFLPNVLTFRALELLGLEDADLASRLEALVAEGVEKLVERQNPDGGWGWWAHERSSVYLTAYAAYGLLRVQEVGFAVDASTLSWALDYLEDELVSPSRLDSNWEANRQAWILYVLALGGRTQTVDEYINASFRERAKLSHYGKALLALTLGETGDADARWETLLSDLINDAILSATGAHWEEEHIDWWAMNTDTRSAAIVLDALVKLDPGNPLIPQVVRWLMVARESGIWETTQENAWALIALTDWMVSTGELRGDYSYGLGFDEELLASGTVTPDTVQDSIVTLIPGDDLATAPVHRLSISRSAGNGRLYYTAHLKVYLPVEEVEALNRGITITRQYVPTDCAFDETCEDLTGARVGESVQVRLTIIAPNDLYYVVVEDPIPAGCEAVDTSLETTSVLESGPRLTRDQDLPWFGWWWNWFSRSELRDEKVVLFADYLAAGTYTYEYTLRAVQPGVYRVLPTSVYEFYFPEVFGRSDGRLFKIPE